MSKQALYLMLFSIVCCLACGSPSATFPAGSPAGTSPFSTEDLQDPLKVVQALEKTLQELPSFRCKLQAVIHIKANGMDNRMASDYSIQIEQPRRWAIIKQSGVLGGTSLSNGQEVTSYIPMIQQYSVEALPEDWPENVPASGAIEAMGLMGPAALASFFMGHGLADWMLDGVNESEYLGREPMDGIDCEHYRYTQEDDSQWELWVEVGERVLFRRLEMTPDVSQAESPRQGMSMSVQMNFSDWETTAKSTEADFVFSPPADAKQVEDLLDGLGGPGAHDQPPHALVGEEAPAFEIQNLAGDTFRLEDYLGDQVIVLDFWATWCGPCTAALPGIAKVAKQFEGKEVLVYAVNQGEEADVVRNFLSKDHLELAVLLDTQGSIGELYAVEGIPMTVVIGKDKRVQVVHVGYSPGMEKKLAQEIEQLLAGEDLASQAKNKANEQSTKETQKLNEQGTNEL